MMYNLFIQSIISNGNAIKSEALKITTIEEIAPLAFYIIHSLQSQAEENDNASKVNKFIELLLASELEAIIFNPLIREGLTKTLKDDILSTLTITDEATYEVALAIRGILEGPVRQLLTDTLLPYKFMLFRGKINKAIAGLDKVIAVVDKYLDAYVTRKRLALSTEDQILELLDLLTKDEPDLIQIKKETNVLISRLERQLNDSQTAIMTLVRIHIPEQKEDKDELSTDSLLTEYRKAIDEKITKLDSLE